MNRSIREWRADNGASAKGYNDRFPKGLPALFGSSFVGAHYPEPGAGRPEKEPSTHSIHANAPVLRWHLKTFEIQAAQIYLNGVIFRNADQRASERTVFILLAWQCKVLPGLLGLICWPLWYYLPGYSLITYPPQINLLTNTQTHKPTPFAYTQH